MQGRTQIGPEAAAVQTSVFSLTCKVNLKCQPRRGVGTNHSHVWLTHSPAFKLGHLEIPKAFDGREGWHKLFQTAPVCLLVLGQEAEIIM